MDGERLHNVPQVLLPAPVYMGLFVGLGVGLNELMPLSYDPGIGQLTAGWLLNGVAAVILLWCFVLFIRRRTTIMPRNPVTTLVTDGPYRYSRNPMYLTLVIFHLAIAVCTGNAWTLLTLVLTVLAIRHFVIVPEESYMRERFGAAYDSYCRQVPRWL